MGWGCLIPPQFVCICMRVFYSIDYVINEQLVANGSLMFEKVHVRACLLCTLAHVLFPVFFLCFFFLFFRECAPGMLAWKLLGKLHEMGREGGLVPVLVTNSVLF